MNIANNFRGEALTTPGVYQIINKVNGHAYIGSSINIWKRWGRHLCTLQRNKHSNCHLQNALNFYGEDNFEFSVLLFCDSENTLVYEQLCLDSFKPEYNMATDVCSPNKGMKHSDETKAKIGKKSLGNKSMLGQKHSDEAKFKMSQSQMGHKVTDEAKLKMSKTRLGGKFSDEHKSKLSESKMGKKHSDETKLKMSQSKMGNKSMLGHKFSDEHKSKLSESQRQRWQKKKDK